SSCTVTEGQWLPAGPGAVTDPVAPGALDLTRLSVEQLDAGGAAVGSPQPVGMGGAQGLYHPGSTQPATPFGFAFSTRVALDPTTRRLRMRLDGTIVDTVQLSAAPTVSLTSPAAGSHVPRGEPLTVSWTAADADSAALSTTVFI